MPEKLSFKISATDDSKNALNSSKKGLKDYKKEITDLLKVSKKTKNPFQNMGKHLKNMQKDFKNINKSQTQMNSSLKKMSSAGDDLADTLKSVNREDEVIAQKMAQKGKMMQQSLKKIQPGQQSQASTMQQAGGQQTKALQKINVLKVDKLETKSFLGKKPSISGMPAKLSPKASEGMNKALGEAFKKIGAKAGMIAGTIIAAIGITYSVASAKAQAFKSGANQQGIGLQQLGFGATGGKPGQKVAGGFYAGYKGKGPGDTSYYMTGQQQVSAMSSYAKQTGAGKGQLEKMMYGKEGGQSLGALTQAYGLDISQTAGTAGMFQRFGRKGEGGMSTLRKTMAGAEGAGMGGARIKEFMDAMQEAVTQGVMSGSNRTNQSMLKGLETLMGTNDERLKALAPAIMKSSSQVMNQAAMLQGGGTGNLAFQAVLSKSKDQNIFGVMEQLSSGDWLENARAILELSKKMGGSKEMSALLFSRNMGANISSPKQQQQLMSMVEQGAVGGKKLTKDAFGKEIENRLKNTAEIIERTTKQDYLASIHTLSEANKDAAATVEKLREAIQKIVDGSYEVGKVAANKFFKTNIDSTESTYR